MKTKYPRWSKTPYNGEEKPPRNPEEPLAGTWPLFFLKRDDHGWFSDLKGKPLPKVKNPNAIDWQAELKVVERTAKRLTREQERIAVYWGTGAVTKQWTPIIDRLIDTYTIFRVGIPPTSISSPRAARILAITQAAIQDALVVCWEVKYRYDVARPVQQNPNFVPLLCTPRHPSYISGHAIVSGAAAEVLSYFFPAEADRLQELALENGVSRLYAGVHFPIDISEGLRIGKAIGRAVIKEIRKEVNADGQPVDVPFTEDRNAQLPPPPYHQIIPFDFEDVCQSASKGVRVRDRLKEYMRSLKS
ncbi:vanadium-dependent haloperoxidase [Peribacillus deserti]|uniref:Chloroperoxidase n=1 Tax=Peribacillus deserti TaxID=673318 RepID=A0A2N5M9W0_9BACI|nr:vanadium-dependent haloperoxidase [Peribacillus deserti]PLT31150.1 chloroperoxidase [Peribacillus deserti]